MMWRVLWTAFYPAEEAPLLTAFSPTSLSSIGNDRAIAFTKMHGAGNDFILLDNRSLQLGDPEARHLARQMCTRRTAIGADGLILMDLSATTDFRMRHYNPDGSRASFCGNGARCLARFAYRCGLAETTLRFDADDGRHTALIQGDLVKLQMVDPTEIHLDRPLTDFPRLPIVHTLNTGVPHAVALSSDLRLEAVEQRGRLLRGHTLFQPDGVNVNFFQPLDAANLAVRTYERGVEAETLSCGTGAVACAVVFALLEDAQPPIRIHTASGEVLTVDFERQTKGIRNVTLEGSAHFVFDGNWPGAAL